MNFVSYNVFTRIILLDGIKENGDVSTFFTRGSPCWAPTIGRCAERLRAIDYQCGPTMYSWVE